MHYLAAYPETVKSLLTEGILPPVVPAWIGIDKIVCTHKSLDCLKLGKHRQDQTFILALDLPSTINSTQELITLTKIEISWVKQIYVSTPRSSKLFNKLLTEHSFNVLIEPKFFAANSPSQAKRIRDLEEKQPEPEVKPNSSNTATIVNNTTVNTLLNVERDIYQNAEAVHRISSYDEHIKLLEIVFRFAQKSILITSFTLNQETLEKAKLFQLIIQATKRRVKIYIYYNDQKHLTTDIINFLKDHGVSFDYAFTHSKLLVMDRKLVAAGSCNWLSMVNSKFPESAEGSLIIQGDCNDLIEDIWSHLRFYRNLQFDNSGAINKFLRNPDNDCRLIYDIDSQNQIGYIPSLNEHLDFLQ
ncbi:MAG TPA: phospholipase D-like domain-containing protein, partial [Gammaproteobacteria bacterium]|nr:phospholipase D-like domain-containing protein [Gammaproteobacteria bacterium]